MKTDFRGVPVSAGSETALAASDNFNRRLVRMDAGVGEIFAAQAAEPDDPLLALYTALVNLYGQQQAGNDAAAELLTQVADLSADLSPRDRMFLGALDAICRRRYREARDKLEALTAAFPEDLLAAKVCEFAYYLLGQHYSGPRFRDHMARLAPAHGDDPDFLGMLSFAYELSDEFAEAEAIGLRAIDAESRNPWAEHAISHALIRQGRAVEGRDRMRAFLPVLRTCDPLIFCHDIWHLALLELDLGDLAEARRILEEDVWGPYPGTSAQQVDAVSLGWRLEMAGIDFGTFWDDVADQAEMATGSVFIPFVSAHLAYALARAGRTDAVTRLITAVRERTAADDEEARHVWVPVGRAVVEAAAAHGAGDFARAASLLEPVADKIAMVGGSDAQTDLFRLSLAVSMARTGRGADARTYWDAVTPARDETEFDRKALGLT
ncbi:MAG: hypothetical protein AAF942_12490 [Pseudomonadota bacterium]